MNYLKTNCEPLDTLLDGVLEKSIITKIYGEAGAGKTNLCLQLSRECAKNGKKVAYIDTEGVSIQRIIQICSDLDYNDILSRIVFFNPSSMDEQESMIKEALKIKKLRPDYLAVEPPELVAGRTSISKAKPELIKNIAKKLRYPFLVGAGIHNNEDVKIAMKLGAKGIAVSSAITTTKNPEKVLKNLIK